MVSLQGLKSPISLSCGSAFGGGSSLLRRKKKKFDYNNGKCLHGLEAVTLKSGTEWNPGRLFLRCPLWENPEQRCEYFVWADEVEEIVRNVSLQERIEESSSKHSSLNVDARTVKADVQKLQRRVNQIGKEIKYIRRMVQGIYFGFLFCALLLCMSFAQK